MEEFSGDMFSFRMAAAFDLLKEEMDHQLQIVFLAKLIDYDL